MFEGTVRVSSISRPSETLWSDLLARLDLFHQRPRRALRLADIAKPPLGECVGVSSGGSKPAVLTERLRRGRRAERRLLIRERRLTRGLRLVWQFCCVAITL